MSGDQSKRLDDTSSTKDSSSSGLSEIRSSGLKEIRNKAKVDLRAQGSTLDSIIKGTVCFDDLVEIARSEFGIDKVQAVKQVLAMINLWQSLRNTSGFGDVNISDYQLAGSLSSCDRSKSPKLPLSVSQLQSPLKELRQLRCMQNKLGTKERGLALDEQLWCLTHNSLESYVAGNVPNKQATNTVAVSPSASDLNTSQSSLTGNGENDGEVERNESVGGEQSELVNLDTLEDNEDLIESDLAYNNSINKVIIPVEQMSVGQRLSREVLLRELGPKECKSGIIDYWDPLACALDNENKSRMVKEIEQDQSVIPVVGNLAPPIRGKGQTLFNRDNTLLKVLEDVNVMIKGSAQSMALTLDNRGDEAVKRSAKVVALGANVMSRLNAERMRIHYPKEFANKILKPVVEPIVREVHRVRARQLAQDIRNQNALMSTLFRKGGRGTREGGRARIWKSNQFSFPRNNIQNKNKRFNNQKFRKSHNQSSKQIPISTNR
jgi:hypothetical protein